MFSLLMVLDKVKKEDNRHSNLPIPNYRKTHLQTKRQTINMGMKLKRIQARNHMHKKPSRQIGVFPEKKKEKSEIF
jgi:hypothetical protein